MRRHSKSNIGRYIILGTLGFFFIIGLAKEYWYIGIPLIIVTAIIIIFYRKYQMNQNFFDLESALANSINANYLLSGVDFEKCIANLLKMDSFRNVKLTPYSGDYGVDIIANYGDRKYVFLCKWYSKNLGLKPIQEIFAGRMYYGADVAVVITNVFFSKNAQELAQKTNVQLWDRKYLTQLVNSARRNVT